MNGQDIQGIIKYNNTEITIAKQIIQQARHTSKLSVEWYAFEIYLRLIGKDGTCIAR